MQTLSIYFVTDSYYCDDCGPSFADGVEAYLDGEKILDLQPTAHCFGGASYDSDEIYQAILKKLGYHLYLENKDKDENTGS